jgi:tryptophan 2,3-dioxygenase
MVPAKWSDFEGWRENFQKHIKAVELVKNTEKSTIESEGIKYYEQRLLFELLGILFCGLWVRNMWYIIRKVSI